MKNTIAGFLLRNALDYAQQASKAHASSQPHEEVRFSIGAHLMAALAIEGIGNEVGERLFDSGIWQRLERADTLLKWYVISANGGRPAFNLGEAPLQHVQRLSSIRNRLAHPKLEDCGDEIIVRTEDGTLVRNAPLDREVQDGDSVFLGYGNLLETFDSKSAKLAVKKSIDAIKALSEHLNLSGLEWIDEADRQVNDQEA